MLLLKRTYVFARQGLYPWLWCLGKTQWGNHFRILILLPAEFLMILLTATMACTPQRRLLAPKQKEMSLLLFLFVFKENLQENIHPLDLSRHWKNCLYFLGILLFYPVLWISTFCGYVFAILVGLRELTHVCSMSWPFLTLPPYPFIYILKFS